MVTSQHIFFWVQIIKKSTILVFNTEHCAKNDALTEYTLGILQICGVLMKTLIFVNKPYLRMHL